jgi:hypothetical protein
MWLTVGSVGTGMLIAGYAIAVACNHSTRRELRTHILRLAAEIDEVASGIERDVQGLHRAGVEALLGRTAMVSRGARTTLRRHRQMTLFSFRRLQGGAEHLHVAHADIMQLRYQADALLAAPRTPAGQPPPGMLAP